MICKCGRRMTEVDRRPSICHVACFTRLIGNKVTRWFARGRASIMARRAIGYDSGVIHACAREGVCAPVAGLASGSCHDMIIRLTAGCAAIVARCAIADDTGVIHTCARKCRCAFVAGLAGDIGDDMIIRFAAGCAAIVT